MPKLFQIILLFAVSMFAPVAIGACPDLTPYYQGNNADWPALEQRLAGLMQECLESSEYFALLGAAQLNSGNIAESLETLERALLQDPDNGAAQIDYAQALFVQGDLFAALELNRQLLRRDDL
ncbi:MAG: tetratricopeptide repeat protein, partial [Gammaproteobacteria bacterium]|nr:tetratricopeptide repeat protein [Gammaproteobacteria bacterium]